MTKNYNPNTYAGKQWNDILTEERNLNKQHQANKVKKERPQRIKPKTAAKANNSKSNFRPLYRPVPEMVTLLLMVTILYIPLRDIKKPH